MQRLRFIFLTALVLAGHAQARAASPYLYLETFENDVDTFTPDTSYGAGGAGHVAPVGWGDQWGVASVEEVPDGFDGVPVGPNGGGHFGQVYGNNTGNPVPPLSPLGAPERTSFQLDFYADPTRPIYEPLYFNSLSKNGRTNDDNLDWMTSWMFAYRNGPGTYLLREYYHAPAGASWELAAGEWYTFEWAYLPGAATDPVTGDVVYDTVLNVYEQAGFGPDGYRDGVLIQSFRGVYDDPDYGGTMPAADTLYAFYMQMNSEIFGDFYVDNLAIGPLINTPEPTAAAVIVGLVGLMMKRPRRRECQRVG